MKYNLLLSSVFFILFSCNNIFAQGFFVTGAGSYINEKYFKTNSQSQISNYEGSYEAVSETYESNYIIDIKSKNEKLNIRAICGHTEDGGENWYSDTLIFENVLVENGEFRIDVNGNTNFRFVIVIFKSVEIEKNITSTGIVMEEYKMYAEKIESGSGNGSKDNESYFIIFDKKLNFGVGADEFQKDFPEFNKHNPQEMEILGREIDKKYMTYAYIKSENSKITEFDPFESIYVILISFINNILVKFEMYGGHSDEGYKIQDAILKQFTLNHTEKDKSLGYDILNLYKPMLLDAFYYYYETAYLEVILQEDD